MTSISSRISKRLEVRLVVMVGLGLLLFATIAGVFTYSYSYRYQLKLAASLQKQLVQTVQVQAEVAAYAANAEIAQGVLNGLLLNPVVLAVRIESTDGFRIEMGTRKSVNFGTGTTYPLYSPVDHIEGIGKMVVVQDDDEVGRTAARAAIFQTGLMLLQILITAAIMATVLRIMMVNPITRLARAMSTIAPGSAMRLELDSKHPDDEIGLLVRSANTILDAAESAINEVKAQRNELERLATHDHLTGLPSLRLAEDRLQVACSNALRNQKKVALLFIDLDGFKLVNDSLGHEAGDDVLRQVAKRLRTLIRAEDTAARIGGDEFVVILGSLVDAQAAAIVARNICTTLATPFDIAGQSAQLGASIGIAVFPDHSGNVETLRQVADSAMYQVKKSGKGNYAFVGSEHNAT